MALEDAMKTFKSIYSSKAWVLGICTGCGQAHYVEPHGTTAECKKCGTWTEHSSIPYNKRANAQGTLVYLNTRADNRNLL